MKLKKNPKVADFLPYLKANRYTYHNLSDKTKADFQRKYAYLRKHKDKEVILLGAKEAKAYLETEYDFLKKYSAMVRIMLAIKH